MKRRHHIAGATLEGHTVFQDCETGEARVMEPLVHGKPIASNTKLAAITDDGDDHVLMEDLGDLHSGPAQVATERYRAGWTRTFSGMN